MQFYSFLMIASPKLSAGDFYPLGSVIGTLENGGRNNIEVVAWNCSDKTGFKPLMETLLAKAEEDLKEQTDNAVLKNNIKCLNFYLRLMATEHEPEKGLKSWVINKIRHDIGAEFVAELTDESFMYLSSVDPLTVPKL